MSLFFLLLLPVVMLAVVNPQTGLSNLCGALCGSSFKGIYVGRLATAMTRCYDYSTELL